MRKSISKTGMKSRPARYDFASDNTAAICPEAWAALQQANAGTAASYGSDEWTEKACDRVREVFETECDVFLVFNGTAANALALAQLCQPFHSVICYERAHIQTDECGAPEFFTHGSKLLTIGGADGKIDLAEAELVIERYFDLHSHKPRVISLTQSTEFGTVYTPEEIARVAEFARRRKILLHMDGARFANAVASLACAPKNITWELGVDVLCFGGTKNGVGAGELVVFFRRDLASEFEYRAKQAGQLASKTRFLAASWNALLQEDVWLRNARHANAAAARLAERLQKELNIEVVFPVQANAIFARLPDPLAEGLRTKGWYFQKFLEPNIYRLMCAWSTTDQAIDELVGDLAALSRS